ncbi:MAG: hypothetical protein P1U64_04025 [Alcanivoracaceae bacterium]|nr:hypothetical protein [Alcanivoracaceae bacterium]
MRAEFRDSATAPGIHQGHVEHEELEISDEELARLKARARRAVTMDGSEPGGNTQPDRFGPLVDYSYQSFLNGGHGKLQQEEQRLLDERMRG